MTVQTLITTKDRDDISFLSDMNIASDCIVSNQKDKNGVEISAYRKYKVKIIYSSWRGVSKARNLLIRESKADVVIFADDDIIFEQEYVKKILDEFKHAPDADGIKFSYSMIGDEKIAYTRPSSLRRAKKRELMSTGVPGFAIKRKKLIASGALFDEDVGPGSCGDIESGEDNLFFADLLRNDVKIYISPIELFKVKNDVSTWYRGMDEKFFISKGRLYSRLYGKKAPLAAFRFAFIRSSYSNLPRRKMISLMLRGIREEKRNMPN